jgi:hypothetical protein
MKQRAMFCYSGSVEHIGYDILVFDHCSAERDSCTQISTFSRDDTHGNNIATQHFFTTEKLTAKKLEVFKITDHAALPADLTKCPNGRSFQ